jgi:hypothetical protein
MCLEKLAVARIHLLPSVRHQQCCDLAMHLRRDLCLDALAPSKALRMHHWRRTHEALPGSQLKVITT